MAHITSRLQPTPSTSTYAPGMPVTARTGALFADNVNYLNAFKFLRNLHIDVENYGNDEPDDAAMSGPTDITGREAIVRALYRVSPVGTRLWVGVWHVSDFQSKATGYIIVNVYKRDGTLIAGPYTWNPTELKGVNDSTESDPTSGKGATMSNEGYVSTSFVNEILDVDGYQGEQLEIKVSQVGCRIYAVDIAEIYFGEL